jgi:hypothetical protein
MNMANDPGEWEASRAFAPGDGRIRHHVEGVADVAAVDGVDPAVEVDVDLAVQRRH